MGNYPYDVYDVHIGSEGPYILLGNGDSIRRISLDGSEGSSVLNNSDYDIIGVDYDIRYGVIRAPMITCV